MCLVSDCNVAQGCATCCRMHSILPGIGKYGFSSMVRLLLLSGCACVAYTMLYCYLCLPGAVICSDSLLPSHPVILCLLLCAAQFIFRNPAWSTLAVLYCLPWKSTIGFSNMRGPAGNWALSGYPVVRIHNGVQPMAFGCFVSLFSYGDTLTFTHTCYSTKTENPQVTRHACYL